MTQTDHPEPQQPTGAPDQDTTVFKKIPEQVFTPEFPDHEYQVTRNSNHPQSKFWPAYLPIQNDRIFIFERSKNAQLVVYTANFSKKSNDNKRVLDPKWPLDINWQSFGWTMQPTSNATGMVERKMAWGYNHKQMPNHAACGAPEVSKVDTSQPCFQVTLNALPTRIAQLFMDVNGRVVLQTVINNVVSRLVKVFVCTNKTSAFIPKVIYVELFGVNVADERQDTYEKIMVTP